MQIESKNQCLFTPALDFGGNVYFIEFTGPTRLRYCRCSASKDTRGGNGIVPGLGGSETAIVFGTDDPTAAVEGASSGPETEASTGGLV